MLSLAAACVLGSLDCLVVSLLTLVLLGLVPLLLHVIVVTSWVVVVVVVVVVGGGLIVAGKIIGAGVIGHVAVPTNVDAISRFSSSQGSSS